MTTSSATALIVKTTTIRKGAYGGKPKAKHNLLTSSQNVRMFWILALAGPLKGLIGAGQGGSWTLTTKLVS